MTNRTPDAIRQEIADWRDHMKCREMGHDLYFTDSHGYASDLAYLRKLEAELAAACPK